jgi:hypothetical protein
MRVYVLIEEHQDDRFGQQLLGVFSTKEKAQKYLEELRDDMIRQG